jgi:hypothetical protein
MGTIKNYQSALTMIMTNSFRQRGLEFEEGDGLLAYLAKLDVCRSFKKGENRDQLLALIEGFYALLIVHAAAKHSDFVKLMVSTPKGSISERTAYMELIVKFQSTESLPRTTFLEPPRVEHNGWPPCPPSPPIEPLWCPPAFMLQPPSPPVQPLPPIIEQPLPPVVILQPSSPPVVVQQPASPPVIEPLPPSPPVVMLPMPPPIIEPLPLPPIVVQQPASPPVIEPLPPSPPVVMQPMPPPIIEPLPLPPIVVQPPIIEQQPPSPPVVEQPPIIEPPAPKRPPPPTAPPPSPKRQNLETDIPLSLQLINAIMHEPYLPPPFMVQPASLPVVVTSQLPQIIPRYKCPHCTLAFVLTSQLRLHVDKVHVPGADAKICQFCQGAFSGLQGLAKHHSAKHAHRSMANKV